MSTAFYTRIAFLLCGVTFAAAVLASPITYLYQGNASGQLGTTAFSNADFIITAIADTDNIKPWSGFEAYHAIQNIHSSAIIEIVGIGSFDILTASHTWVADCIVSGRTCGGIGKNLGFNWLTIDEGLGGYHLSTQIGPISDSTPLAGGSFGGVLTSGGTLFVRSATPVEFTARIPGPTTLALLALGIAGIHFPRCRSRRAISSAVIS